MQSKITLLGMYNFDNSLFDKLTFPTGIDRDLAINRILNKSEEFELVYSDFDYLQDRIGIWGEMWERTFTKWVEALSIDYSPLHNYDRTELYTDTHQRDYEDKSNSNYTDGAAEHSTSNSNTVTGSETNSTTEQKVYAYDEADYSNREKETAGASTNQSGSGNAVGDVTRNAAGGTNSNESGVSNEVVKHEAHLFGNIGVTTSQQMLRDQLDIVTWNLYEHISDIFIDEFCILVY